MAHEVRKLISILAGGALAAMIAGSAGAQSLGGTLGGIVGGVTDGLGITADASVGGSNTVSADVGIGTTSGNIATADVDIGLGGLLGSTTGTSVNANATVGTTTTTASLNVGTPGIPGLALPNLNAELNLGLPVLPDLSVNLGINPPVTPSTQTPPVVGTPQTPAVIASLSAEELARMKVECRQILANPASFGADLVSLCRLIRTASR